MSTDHANDFQTTTGDHRIQEFESENAKAFAETARLIREGAGPDAGGASWSDRTGSEQQQIVRMMESGIVPRISEEDLDKLPVLSEKTSEHKVLMPFCGTRVTKVTHSGFYGQIPILEGGMLRRRNAYPAEYLERQALQNEIFASDIKLEGATISTRQSMVIGDPVGQPSFVISQGFVEALNTANPIPSEEQIADFLSEHGFKAFPKSYFGWTRASDGVALVDAKPDNFMLTDEGVVPIDLQIAIIPELAAESSEPSLIILP